MWGIDSRFIAPILITLILLGGQLSFGILESYLQTLTAIGVAIIFEIALSKITTGKMPHSGKRVYYGHQRRDFDSFARLLDVCAVRGDLDNFQIRSQSKRPSHLESVKFRCQFYALCRAVCGGESFDSVGQQSLRDDGHLASRFDHHLSSETLSHHIYIRRGFSVFQFYSEAFGRVILSSRKSRRSRARCISFLYFL